MLFFIFFVFNIRRHFPLHNVTTSDGYRMVDFSNHSEHQTLAHSNFFRQYLQQNNFKISLGYFPLVVSNDFLSLNCRQLQSSPTILPLGIYIPLIQSLVRLSAFHSLYPRIVHFTSLPFAQQQSAKCFLFISRHRCHQLYNAFRQLYKLKILLYWRI
jgi:hypothetical protein